MKKMEANIKECIGDIKKVPVSKKTIEIFVLNLVRLLNATYNLGL